MERLYFSKAVTPEEKDTDFNCDYVKLEKDDLFTLKVYIEEKVIDTFDKDGYFFGHEDYNEERRKYDLEFVEAALKEIDAGNDIYYYAWW